MKKYRPYFISILIFGIAIIWGLVKNNLSLLTLSDTLFMLGLPFLIVGILLWVFSSGFFDTFQRSMHEALGRKQKKKANYTPLSQVGDGVYGFWLKIAGVIFVLSLIFLMLNNF
ncbi:DUF3899 domain-containing protein [Enterococcus dispar]|uniref:DUF3899 domain-containing protein n=2 Tax=Enterococcus TaxID=1350 RepID=S1P057_9ENTE|nr:MULTISPECIES: DUF3899 domain-containing protein [Enterococcus]EOT40238.1 hypothetical protein OMK_02090 [Enterococcus dispar ATCC 51266]EOW86479.1 hypothetical protein I569_01814 [Enterococcus dispar ATCC 51266]MCU7357393.1 DUF3899 domain-containing protein [Enterococcus dispar]MDT2706023.1 DUF3899 domain-containing protein [Enterococcus dispar]WCG32048.1 DUF3899 domain-containing protein [Enterococcus dispar]